VKEVTQKPEGMSVCKECLAKFKAIGYLPKAEARKHQASNVTKSPMLYSYG
jgi:ribosomal protein L37AE/L43A